MTLIVAPPSRESMPLDDARGFSLVELLVAMTIGLVLIGGALQVYINSRNTYQVNESTARLQETARYALSILEPDIRMAGYWGLAKDHLMISGREPQPSALNPAPTILSTLCGENYIVDLSTPVQGSNNAYAFGSNPTGCNAFNNNARQSSDTLTVRHASIVNTVANDTRYRICSSRSGLAQVLDTAAVFPCNVPGQLNNLMVNNYYISNESTANSGGVGVPSLRIKTLNGGAPGIVFDDNEVIAGIEDLQIQFGIDPGISPAVPMANVPLQHCGLARFYVNPGAVPAAVLEPQVVSVRVWLLVRADSPELGFIDNALYEYADRDDANGETSDLSNAAAATLAFRPQGDAQVEGFRRLLVSRTYQLRNSEALDSLATSAGNPCP